MNLPLFDYQIAYQSDCKNHTNLPFQIFGMSQQGSAHISKSIGNQDAASVFIGKNILIGVIADGCSQGKNINAYSYNQVGALIACNLNIKVIRRLLTRQKMSLSKFKSSYTELLTTQYKRVFNSFSPWKNERRLMLSNIFSSTFLGFIILPDNFLVFHYGDGNTFINSKNYRLKTNLDNYFTNRLITQNQIPDPINFSELGKTKDLKNLVITTDGLSNEYMRNNNYIKKFFFSSPSYIPQVGFVDRKTEFRVNVVKQILKDQRNADWPQDDATFISLKRTTNSK